MTRPNGYYEELKAQAENPTFRLEESALFHEAPLAHKVGSILFLSKENVVSWIKGPSAKQRVLRIEKPEGFGKRATLVSAYYLDAEKPADNRANCALTCDKLTLKQNVTYALYCRQYTGPESEIRTPTDVVQDPSTHMQDLGYDFLCALSSDRVNLINFPVGDYVYDVAFLIRGDVGQRWYLKSALHLQFPEKDSFKSLRYCTKSKTWTIDEETL